MECNIYGTKVETLSTVIEKFCIESGNVNENHFMATMLRGERVWYDLLKDTIWTMRQAVIPVPENGIIKMPKDLTRLVNISVVDNCNKFQSLAYDPKINTLLFSCRPTCTCTSCNGAGSLCDTVNSIQVRTEDIDIDGTTYQKKIWNAMCPNGDFAEYTETPYYNSESEEVEVVKESRIVCNFDTDENNCIKPTIENKNKLTDCCGQYLPETVQYNCDSYCKGNDIAAYNFAANSKGEVHLFNVPADSVVVSYQSNGSCNGRGELMIPIYAIDALQFGLIYRQLAFKVGGSSRDFGIAERNYLKAKDDLYQYLNPIRMDDIKSIAGIIPKWG